MTRQQELIALYDQALRTECGVTPDPDLLRRVALGCGPLIYDAQTACVDADDRREIARIRRNFLVGKLGLRDGPELTDAIETMLELYDAPPGRKYRAVLYYMLVQYFSKAHLYR